MSNATLTPDRRGDGKIYIATNCHFSPSPNSKLPEGTDAPLEPPTSHELLEAPPTNGAKSKSGDK